jgi:serine/threonine protein kinase
MAERQRRRNEDNEDNGSGGRRPPKIQNIGQAPFSNPVQPVQPVQPVIQPFVFTFDDNTDNIKNYSIKTDRTIGSTPLVIGYDVSVVPPARITAKFVESDATAAFMATEGRVYHALSNQPHPNMFNVRCCLRASDGKERTYVISDAGYGDLQSYMRSRQDSPLPEAQALTLFSQLVDALVYCHRNRIVLRDMKLSKVMFSDANHTRIVITDLTNAIIMPVSVNVVHDQQGSPAYVAPEVLSGRPYDPFKTDIWSLGVMLFVLLSGRYPFRDARPSVLFRKITVGPIEVPEDFPPAARALVIQMLSRDPALRPTIQQIKDNLWVSGGVAAAPVAVPVPQTVAPVAAPVAAEEDDDDEDYSRDVPEWEPNE